MPQIETLQHIVKIPLKYPFIGKISDIVKKLEIKRRNNITLQFCNSKKKKKKSKCNINF